MSTSMNSAPRDWTCSRAAERVSKPLTMAPRRLAYVKFMSHAHREMDDWDRRLRWHSTQPRLHQLLALCMEGSVKYHRQINYFPLIEIPTLLWVASSAYLIID